MKKILVLIISMIMMFSIVGCSKENTEQSQKKSESKEDILKDFLDKRKNKKYSELAELVNPEYLDAMELTKEKYAENLETDDFKYSREIVEQKVGKFEKYDDNLDYVKVMTKLNTPQGENVIEEYISVNKEGMVGPYGFVRAYQWDDNKPVGDNKITVELKTYVECVNNSIIRIKWDNKTNNDIALGWGDSGKILIETDKGSFRAQTGITPRIPTKYNGMGEIFIPNAKGRLKKVTIGPLLELKNSLPDMNNPTNIVITIKDE